MMNGLCPNLYFMLLVSIFTTRCSEVTQKHLDSPNNLVTDFYELTNSNVSNYKL